ncbi:hypothetical protein C8F01DRAFT_1360485, partial [Mycena amicta]
MSQASQPGLQHMDSTRSWFWDTFGQEHSRSKIQTALAESISDIIQDMHHDGVLGDSIYGHLLYNNNDFDKAGKLFEHLDAQRGNIELVLAFQQAVFKCNVDHVLNGELEIGDSLALEEMRQVRKDLVISNLTSALHLVEKVGNVAQKEQRTYTRKETSSEK